MTPDCAWRADIFGIDTGCYITVVGWHEADEAGLSQDELSDLNAKRKDARERFSGFEPIPPDLVPGPIFSVSNKTYYTGDGRLKNRGDSVPKTPPPITRIPFPAVTADCKAVLERHDLGATEFYPITVLNAERTEPFWPEVYLMHVRNQKSTIDIEKSIAEGSVREHYPGERFRQAFLKHGLEVPEWYKLVDGETITLETNALEGPDLWFEAVDGKMTDENLYISDALKRDLERKGMIDAWRVTEARIR